jgi:small subunit ribosomal protein S4
VARYIGPKAKLSRREGTDLFLKSARRSLDSKCKLDVKPGQHGANRAPVPRTTATSCAKSKSQAYTACWNVSSAATSLKLTVAKATPVKPAEAAGNPSGQRCYRMGFGSTRAEARQLVSHKAFTVNGQVVNIASYSVKSAT